MTRKPDEIKKGLEVCNIWMVDEPNHCMECPYFCTKDCADTLMKHALALIQQLEAQNAEKDARIQQLEAERDAAVNFLRSMGCDTCMYDDYDGSETPCINCTAEQDYWMWRGVTKEASQ